MEIKKLDRSRLLVPDKVMPSDQEFSSELAAALGEWEKDPSVQAARRTARGQDKYKLLEESTDDALKTSIKSGLLKKLAMGLPLAGVALAPEDGKAEALFEEALPPGMEPERLGPEKGTAAYDLETGKIPDSLKYKEGGVVGKKYIRKDLAIDPDLMPKKTVVEKDSSSVAIKEKQNALWDKQYMKKLGEEEPTEDLSSTAKKQAIKDLLKKSKGESFKK